MKALLPAFIAITSSFGALSMAEPMKIEVRRLPESAAATTTFLNPEYVVEAPASPYDKTFVDAATKAVRTAFGNVPIIKDNLGIILIVGIGIVLGLVGLVATWNMGLGPRWYAVSLAVVARKTSGPVVPARLPLYARPGDTATRRYLVREDRVELLDEKDGWVKVRYANPTRGDILGWVNANP